MSSSLFTCSGEVDGKECRCKISQETLELKQTFLLTNFICNSCHHPLGTHPSSSSSSSSPPSSMTSVPSIPLTCVAKIPNGPNCDCYIYRNELSDSIGTTKQAVYIKDLNGQLVCKRCSHDVLDHLTQESHVPLNPSFIVSAESMRFVSDIFTLDMLRAILEKKVEILVPPMEFKCSARSRFLVLPPSDDSMIWDEDVGRALYERPCYLSTYKFVQKIYYLKERIQNFVLLLGNPGIGMFIDFNFIPCLFFLNFIIFRTHLVSHPNCQFYVILYNVFVYPLPSTPYPFFALLRQVSLLMLLCVETN